MSWSVNITGKSHEIAIAFDEERNRVAANGMIEDEQRDVDEARDFAEVLAATHDATMSVSASGHWVTPPGNADQPPGSPRFGRVSVTIERVES